MKLTRNETFEIVELKEFINKYNYEIRGKYDS